MKKLAGILCVLLLASCTTGTKEIENKHWAHVHQVIEQSGKQKVALANVGDVSTINALEIIARNVKLVLKNCQYEDDWIDNETYMWRGKLEKTHKSFTYTTGYGTQRTIPIYDGDCSVNRTKIVECISWDRDCVIDSEPTE